jgi:hypothetical protein
MRTSSRKNTGEPLLGRSRVAQLARAVDHQRRFDRVTTASGLPLIRGPALNFFVGCGQDSEIRNFATSCCPLVKAAKGCPEICAYISPAQRYIRRQNQLIDR